MNTDVAPAIQLRDLVKTFPGRGEAVVRAVAASTCTSSRARSSRSSARTAPARPPPSTCCSACREPTDGSVEVLGLAPRQAIARGLVSAVMQTGGLLKDLTVRETVEYTASLFADTQPVDAVLAHAGISRPRRPRVGKCSGGEQQRLRFAMALLSDPALLLLDEPTSRHGRRGPARPSGRRSAGRRARAARCCSRRTTSRRPTSTPTGSC